MFRLIGSPGLPEDEARIARGGRPRPSTAATTRPAPRASSRRSWRPATAPAPARAARADDLIARHRRPAGPVPRRRGHGPRDTGRGAAGDSRDGPRPAARRLAEADRRVSRANAERAAATGCQIPPGRGARAPAGGRARASRRRAGPARARGRARTPPTSASRRPAPSRRRILGRHRPVVRIPVEPERLVDRHEHARARAPRRSTTITTPVCDAARHHALAEAGQLAPRRARSRCSGPGSTRRGPPPRARRRRDARERASRRPAVASKRSWMPGARLVVGLRVRQLERALVEDRGAAAGEPHDRLEAGGASGRAPPHRSRARRGRAWRTRRAARPREAQRLGQLAAPPRASISARERAVSSAGSSGKEPLSSRRARPAQ